MGPALMLNVSVDCTCVHGPDFIGRDMMNHLFQQEAVVALVTLVAQLREGHGVEAERFERGVRARRREHVGGEVHAEGRAGEARGARERQSEVARAGAHVGEAEVGRVELRQRGGVKIVYDE